MININNTLNIHYCHLLHHTEFNEHTSNKYFAQYTYMKEADYDKFIYSKQGDAKQGQHQELHWTDFP